MALLTIGGQKVNEDSYRFPSPDLTIQSVTRKEALKSLGSKGMKQGHGIVYFYLDRGYLENNVVYIGESGNSIQSRHNATHSKSQWFANLRYPLIGVVQSPYRRWDTDTRRAIEAQIVYELRQCGFTPFNHENSTWKDGVDFSIYDEPAYLKSVVDNIVEYILFHLGLGNDEILPDTAPSATPAQTKESPTPASTDKAGVANSDAGVLVETAEENPNRSASKNTSYRRRTALHSPIWNEPIEGRELFYSNKKKGVSAYAYQTADGQTVLTRVDNLPAVAAPYAKHAAKRLHDQLLSEAIEKDGMLMWTGNAGPFSGSATLSAAVGGSMSKADWEENSHNE